MTQHFGLQIIESMLGDYLCDLWLFNNPLSIEAQIHAITAMSSNNGKTAKEEAEQQQQPPQLSSLSSHDKPGNINDLAAENGSEWIEIHLSSGVNKLLRLTRVLKGKGLKDFWAGIF